MTALDRRPAGAFASGFYVFACVFFAVGYTVRTVSAILLFAVFLSVLFIGRIPYRRGICALVAGVFAASLFSCAVVDIRIPSVKDVPSGECAVTGTVEEVRYRSSWSGIYTVESEYGKLILTCGNGELTLGDRISCTAKFTEDDEYLEYTKADGMFLSAEAVGEVSLDGYSNELGIKTARLRERLSSTLRSAMSDRSGGFAASLLLGDRSVLPDEVNRDFRTLGISHVLALSGTHLTVLFFGISRLIPEKRRILRLAVICPAVILYMALVGFSSSVTRAGIMFIIGMIGSALGKNTDSFTSLSVSVLLICILDPYAPFDVGLQLSYLSVVGLIISGEIVKNFSRGKLFEVVIPSLVVPSVILPLMWLDFGEVSLVSPIANIVMVPVATLLIPLCAVLIILSTIPRLFLPLSSAADEIISRFLGYAESWAEAADPVLPLGGTLSAVIFLLLVAVLACAILSSGKARTVLSCLPCILVCAALLSSQIFYTRSNETLSVCLASKGDDSAVSIVKDGYHILVDVGRYPSAVKSAVRKGTPYGSERIDALFITKPYKSQNLILNEIANNYYLSSLWLPAWDNAEDAATAAFIREEAENMGISVYTYIPGEILNFGECEFAAPKYGKSLKEAEFSVTYGTDTIIYSGGTLSGGGLVIVSKSAAILSDAVSDNAYVTDLGMIRVGVEASPVIFTKEELQ